ncbi:hypothetical protein BB561_006528 [Smittium simulii]|uniref:Endonuclease/exonuclease/phosphatase domain-containing protein n=1 Tax=Smittium simulii TaxID=133385 RepID=A0A2T9Y3D7_9FUNG|nr:hypothetical protein BB561_006528 [Smittium simulii]
MSSGNKNLSARRMANLVGKFKNKTKLEFIEQFMDSNNYNINKNVTGVTETNFCGFESDRNAAHTAKTAGMHNNRLMVWNIPELAKSTFKRLVAMHTKLQPGQFTINKVRQKNSEWRYKIATQNNRLSQLKIKKLAKKLGAKIRYDKHKSLRGPQRTVNKKQALGQTKFKCMSYNLIGIKNVKNQLEYMLNSYQPILLTLQETMLTEKSSRCRLQGYTCIEVKHKIKKGGRGLLTVVRNTADLTIFEYLSNSYWMATKVSDTLEINNKVEMMVINVHTPSSLTKKKQVTEHITSFSRNYKLKHPDHIILSWVTST